LIGIIASANQGVTKILITTWPNSVFLVQQPKRKQGQRNDLSKREKNIGSRKEEITGRDQEKSSKE
jgi:hypothetical protein